MNLYEFQQKALDELKEGFKLHNSLLLQSPTGSGKTVIVSKFVQDLPATAKVLWLVNRTALVSQTVKTFRAQNSDITVVHNEIKYDTDGNKINLLFNYQKQEIIGINEKFKNSRFILSMAQTFLNANGHLEYFNPDYIIIDEAHKSTSGNYQIIRDTFPNAKILGMTATPFRERSEDGEHLREWYQDVVVTNSISELMKIGKICKAEYIQLSEMDHIVESWKDVTKNSKNNRTIIFTRDTKHSVRVVESFINSGIEAEIITTSNDDEVVTQTVNVRNEIYKRFRNGKTKVLVSVNALCEGFDEPTAKYCFLLRNVGSDQGRNPALYHQMCGRVLRPHETKDCGVIVDFCNNLQMYGPVEDWEWDFTDSGPQLTHIGHEREILYSQWERYKRIYITCESCYHVYDVKKFDACICCNQKNTVERLVRISTLRDKVFDSIENKKLLNMFNDSRKSAKAKKAKNIFPVILEKIKLAKQRGIGLQFNKMYQSNIFDDDEEFNEEFKFLDELISIRIQSLDDQLKLKD